MVFSHALFSHGDGWWFPSSRGLIIPSKRIRNDGGMTICQIASLYHGTYALKESFSGDLRMPYMLGMAGHSPAGYPLKHHGASIPQPKWIPFLFPSSNLVYTSPFIIEMSTIAPNLCSNYKPTQLIKIRHQVVPVLCYYIIFYNHICIHIIWHNII